MKRPRRPVKRKVASIKTERNKIITGLQQALDHVVAAPKVLATLSAQIGPLHDFQYRWIPYPDDPGARAQISKQGWDPVPYIDFAGALPSKDGFVHFQGQTLVRQRAMQLTTASLSPNRFVVISLTITEKAD